MTNNKILIDPKNDVLFKLMFGRECNKDLTLHLLNSVMEGFIDPIEDIEYLQSEKEVGLILPGFARIDVNCVTSTNHKFIAEMQKCEKDFFIERCLNYLTSTYSAQKRSIKEGLFWVNNDDDFKNTIPTGYENVYPTRLIGFLNYIQFDKISQHINHFTFVNQEYNWKIDALSLTFVEFKKKRYDRPEDIKTNLDRWIYFFQNSKDTDVDQLFKYLGKDKAFDKAYQQLEYNSYAPEDRKFIDEVENAVSIKRGERNAAIEKGRAEGRAEGLQRGRAEGRAEGLKEGEKKGEKIGEKNAKIEMAKKMLLEGLSIDLVAKCSGLSIDEIKNLI